MGKEEQKGCDVCFRPCLHYKLFSTPKCSHTHARPVVGGTELDMRMCRSMSVLGAVHVQNNSDQNGQQQSFPDQVELLLPATPQTPFSYYFLIAVFCRSSINRLHKKKEKVGPYCTRGIHVTISKDGADLTLIPGSSVKLSTSTSQEIHSMWLPAVEKLKYLRKLQE